MFTCVKRRYTMKTILSTLVLLAAARFPPALIAARAADAATPSPEETALRERGQRIVARTFAALSGELTKALTAGGVTNALPVCAEQASPLLVATARDEGVTIRRVTERHRNPANAPDEQERRVLERFAATLREGAPPVPVVHHQPDGAALYFAPIILNNPLCLRCHGTPGRDIQPDDLALIRKLYPGDRATGFALNDLRGLWRVDFPAASTANELSSPEQEAPNSTPTAP
jgi:ketosteroid isomerase-like protein